MGIWNRIRKKTMLRLAVAENNLSKHLSDVYSIDGKERRIYYYHIRKTGGTSINHMFLSTAGEPGEDVYRHLNKSPIHRSISGTRVFVGWHQRLIEQGRYFYAFSHIPRHKLRLPPHTFTFTCLREPVKRVMSHYRMILEHKGLGKTAGEVCPESKWLGKNFGDFLLNIPREHLLNQIFMFSKKFDVNEACDNIQRCSYFFLLERFADGIKELSEKTGIPLEPLHIRKSKIEISISKIEMERLHEMLSPEIEVWNRLAEVWNSNESQL